MHAQIRLGVDAAMKWADVDGIEVDRDREGDCAAASSCSRAAGALACSPCAAGTYAGTNGAGHDPGRAGTEGDESDDVDGKTLKGVGREWMQQNSRGLVKTTLAYVQQALARPRKRERETETKTETDRQTDKGKQRQRQRQEQ
jgi:hypothetical protein